MCYIRFMHSLYIAGALGVLLRHPTTGLIWLSFLLTPCSPSRMEYHLQVICNFLKIVLEDKSYC